MKSTVFSLATLILLLPFSAQRSAAQQMQETRVASPSAQLVLTGLDGTVVKLTPAALKAMPHTAITVLNAHNGKTGVYSGVVLADLLARVNAPIGTALKGRLFMTGVVAAGTDGYRVLYSIAEVDPVMHSGDVIVADSLDGAPLGNNGAFQLIDSEDKRPARWVRNLASITVTGVETR